MHHVKDVKPGMKALIAMEVENAFFKEGSKKLVTDFACGDGEVKSSHRKDSQREKSFELRCPIFAPRGR